MRQKIAAANWKMNLPKEGIEAYFETLRQTVKPNSTRTVWCVPAPFLEKCAAEVEKIFNSKIAAQNIFHKPSGAFTGEISSTMLKQIGITATLIGHSERRGTFKEDQDMLTQKCLHALEQGLEVIYCVGETLEQRKSEQTWDVLSEQLATIKSISETDLKKFCIAYEPIWAIGTGVSATSEQAEQAHQFIRQQIAEWKSQSNADHLPILYGGSVSPENVTDLSKQENIDGCLVGGASLIPEKFAKIIAAWKEI